MASYFSQVSSSDVEYLEKLCGSNNVSIAEEDLVTNAIDAQLGGFHRPEVVVWPENSEQISKILKYADEKKIPVYPRGGGTGLTGTVPIYRGIVVNMKKMNKIIEVDEDNMQTRVQPGIVYDNLNRELERYGLFFPPDPSSGASCTVGGMVASNASGLKAVKYGTTREYVLGFEAAFPKNGLLRLGTKTFKYSLGFDIVKMLVGSQGTLAIFTEVTLRLRPLPESMATVAAFFKSIAEANRTIYNIVRRGLDVAALEFMDKSTMNAVSEFKKINFPDAEAMLLIETHGCEKTVSEELGRCINIVKQNGGFEIWHATSKEERERLWAARKGAYPSVLKLGRYTLISDVIIPLSRLVEAVQKAYDIGNKYGLKTSCIGHFGDGNLHVNWGTDKSIEDLHRANDELNRWVISIGGAVSGEHGIGTEKKAYMKLQHGESYNMMIKIKRLLDPNFILSPGIIFELEDLLSSSG
ncbi:MAG: FAD-linked oxidase C-terminal domain-containing protein [Nitrososphaerota archaeon]